MAHKFDPKHIGRLDNPERRKALPPEEVLRAAGMLPGDTVADIGAGIGYFSFAAAKLAGPGGRIYAIDSSPDMLRELRNRIASSGGSTVVAVQSGEYEIMLPDESVDFAFMCNVLHEVEDKDRFLKAVRAALKPGGRLAVVEWQKKPMEIGPPVGERIDPDEAADLVRRLAFNDVTRVDYSDTYYIVTAKKP